MKRYKKAYLLLLLCAIAVMAVSCAKDKQIQSEMDLVWPPAPAEPRIKYKGFLARPEDLGIRKGFFERLGEIVAGKKQTEIVQPMAVVTNGRGDLFVADPGIKGVHKYNREKGTYQIIKGKDNNDLASPVGLASDGEGNVYITDSELRQVFKVEQGSIQAIPLALKHTFVRPTGIAIDNEDGNILVVDTGLHSIFVFAQDGTYLKKIGKLGIENGEFNYPTYIWRTRSGELLVSDSLNFRIQKFNKDEQFIGQFGKLGDATGDLSRPKGVAEDRHGHIYVVDSLFHSVQVFNESGSLLLNFGTHGAAPGEFWLPTGIYIDNDETIYVADSYNRRVQIFSYVGN